jgi:hypothetical protein
LTLKRHEEDFYGREYLGGGGTTTTTTVATSRLKIVVVDIMIISSSKCDSDGSIIASLLPE